MATPTLSVFALHKLAENGAIPPSVSAWGATPSGPGGSSKSVGQPSWDWPTWREYTSELSRTYNPYDPKFSEPAKDNLEYALRAGARGAMGAGAGAVAALPVAVAGPGLTAATAGLGALGAGAAMSTEPAPSAPAPAPEKPPQFEPGAMHYGLGGAGAGALLGAAMGRKGTRGRNALIGAGLGGGAGLLAQYLMNKKSAQDDINVNDVHMGQFAGGTGAAGAVAGGIAGLAGGGLAGLLSPGEYEDENGVMKRRGRLMGALRGAGKGGLVGAAGGGALGAVGGAGLLGLARIMHNTVHAPRVPQDKTANMGGVLGMLGGQSLSGAGASISGALSNAGRELKNMYNKVPESVRSGAGMGGLGGAALGGLAGLVAPGEDVEYDEMGREVKRNPRSRFGAMMRGAVGGGLAGAAGGAAAGHFAPGQTQQAADYLRQQGHNLHQKYLMSQLPRQELPAGMVA